MTVWRLHGRQKVTLFPPRQWSSLHPFDADGTISWTFARATPSAADFEQCPRLKAALHHRLETELVPGDVLFVPACWAQERVDLEGTEHVLSVNRLWRAPSERVLPHLPDAVSEQLGVSQANPTLPRLPPKHVNG